jgi:hypothetical protein
MIGISKLLYCRAVDSTFQGQTESYKENARKTCSTDFTVQAASNIKGSANKTCQSVNMKLAALLFALLLQLVLVEV